MKTYAVILAAGASERFSGGVSKQFVRIAGRTVLEHTLAVFESAEEIDEIILVIPAKQREKVQRILSRSEHAKVHRIVEGGETRRESSARGIESIPEDVQEGYVIIHDCARPFVTRLPSEIVCTLYVTILLSMQPHTYGRYHHLRK